MEVIVKEMIDPEEKEKIARDVLYDLPEWFGLPESTESYIEDSRGKLLLASFVDKEPAGYIVLGSPSKDCAEIFVMGVKKKFHRMGIGTKMYHEYEERAKKLGYTYSQVKTVQMGHYKEYDIANHFYIAMGYKELECFPGLWNEWNPCQIYVKYIGEV